MSWQAYIDTSLIGTGNVDQAAIFSVDGASPWAASPGFNVTAQEMKTIVGSFQDSSQAIMGTGFHIAGVKYMSVKSDDRTLVGKQGKKGVVCVKTKQTILVAHHGEDTATTNTSATVEALADYLINTGY